MRTLSILGTGLALALLSASCSSNDKDPITTACETACKLDPSDPCASHVNDCVLDCRSWANKAQAGPYMTDCYKCVAASYKYVSDAKGCGAGGTVWVTHTQPTDPACYKSCVPSD